MEAPEKRGGFGEFIQRGGIVERGGERIAYVERRHKGKEHGAGKKRAAVYFFDLSIVEPIK